VTLELKKNSRGAGRVAFLARIEDIRKMIDAGYTLLVIYEKYEKSLKIGYSQFARYVTRYIRSKPRHENEGEKPAPATEAKAIDPGEKRKPGFTHDPSSGSNRDDLI
jgi:hypothetical protein